MVDTRAGFWLQVATVAITVLVVIIRLVVGDAADHTFTSVLTVGVIPAAALLPVAGILLVTSEWSQRTGMITFALVPARSRVLRAKLIASIVLALSMLGMSIGVIAAGVLVASPGVDGTWSDVAPLIGQSAVYLTAGMLVGVAFGMVLLASAPAIVALFALPITWAAVASLAVEHGLGGCQRLQSREMHPQADVRAGRKGEVASTGRSVQVKAVGVLEGGWVAVGGGERDDNQCALGNVHPGEIDTARGVAIDGGGLKAQ
jgi:hypothetical protein